LTYQIFNLPKQSLGTGLALKPSWKISFFLTTTTTPTPVYTTSALTTTHTQPVQADAGGILATIYLDPAIVYKASVYDQNDVLQYTVDPVNDNLLSQSSIGLLLYPRTAAEITAGVTPTNYYIEPLNVLRYGTNTTPGTTDMTAAIQAAVTVATYLGHAVIPPGVYKTTSTVSIPMGSFGAFTLEIQTGAVINYSGSGYAFDAATPAIAYANVNIVGGGDIVGNSSGLAGIRYYCFNRGLIQGIRCRGFTTGSGILIEGANTIDLLDIELVGNQDGIRLVAKLDGGLPYAANACRLIGGHINNNSRWGIYDDATGTGGASNSNNYYATTFDPNGSNGAGSGNIFIQGGIAHVIASYMEYSPSQYGKYNIVLGDATYHPVATVIRDTFFAGLAAVTASIYDNGTSTFIHDNTEVGACTYFIEGGTAGVQRRIGPNNASVVGAFFGGTDNGDTMSIGNPTDTLASSMSPSATGMAMKTICGKGGVLSIRARDSGDTNIANFLDYGGSTVAGVSKLGAFKVGRVTVANLPAAASFTDYILVVTDANATTQNSIVAAGGANVMLVKSDGTNWRIV
jgi:hypothetical protein